MIKEFKLLARGLVFSVLLAGCGTRLTDSVEKEIEIGGLAKHYHTGDEVTLTAWRRRDSQRYVSSLKKNKE